MTTSVADGMIRPRILYAATSHLSVDAFNSSSVRINLQKQIIPNEGFSLAAGLRSFGFNATAYNISEEQKNNILYLRLTYRNPLRKYVNGSQVVDSNSNYEDRETYTIDQKIIIPDGLYQTLSELFELLSSSSGGLYFLWSGIYTDPENGPNEPYNLDYQIPLTLKWEETSYGFSIAPLRNNIDIYPKHGGENMYEYIHQLEKIEILRFDPTNTTEKKSLRLYDLLFTNIVDNQSVGMNQSEYANSVISKNPPDSIVFLIDKYEEADTSLVNYFPLQNLDFDILEMPFKQIDSSQQKWQLSQLPYRSLPWKSFSTPIINPLFFDVICGGITTNSLTEQGDQSNLLHRQFLGGAAEGLTSSFQEFSTLIYMRFDYRESIDHLELSFKSENDLWYFYNMQFYLEIVFFEVPEEQAEEQQIFVPPIQEEEFTNAIQNYTNARSNLQSYSNPIGRQGVVFFSQSENRDKKRRR
jgi:hypothetical protein